MQTTLTIIGSGHLAGTMGRLWRRTGGIVLHDVLSRTLANGHAGITEDVAMQMMEPLVRKTVDLAFAAGTAAALSGPIARGDTVTVDMQCAAVGAWGQDKGALYALLAKKTLVRAQRRRHDNR